MNEKMLSVMYGSVLVLMITFALMISTGVIEAGNVIAIAASLIALAGVFITELVRRPGKRPEKRVFTEVAAAC